MAEWVDARGREDPPPPEIPAALTLFFNIQNWGDPWGRGWMGWPAGWMPRIKLARNVYQAWSAYTAAADRVAWSKDAKNAQWLAVVGEVKALRFEEPDEETAVARWERWNGLRAASDE